MDTPREVRTALLDPRLAELGPRDWVRRLLPAALLTCVVALYNHFPLTFPDTGNYIGNAVSIAHGREPWFFYRPLTYGLFLVPFSRSQTIWLLPLAQGLLVAFVIDLALRIAGVSLSNGWLLGLFAVLSAFTSLPWFSGQIMPDIFTGVVILLAFVTFWGGEQQTRRERLVTGTLLAFAIGTHLTHFPLYGLLLIAGFAGRAMGDRASRPSRPLGAIASWAIAPLVVAVGLVMAPNYAFYREPVLSRSSALFTLAHLVGEGAAQDYLNRACPTQHYLLCSERASLQPSMDWFLWAPGGPWKQHQSELQRGDSTFLRDARAIASGTLRQEWPVLLRALPRKLAAQLTTFEIHPGEHRFSKPVEQELKALGPRIVQAYRASREVRHALPVEVASRVHYTAVGLGLLVLLGCLPMLRGRLHSPIRALIAMVCLGVLVNAVVIVSLANVQDRYQSRVVWLVPLVAAAAAAQVFGIGRRSSPE